MEKRKKLPCEIFSINLRLERQLKGLTQKYMADKLFVEVGTYSKWENGRREPGLYGVASLARILGVPIDTFFDEDTAAKEARYKEQMKTGNA